jgi:serine/threonine protein phosphatase PrpC
MRVRFSARTHVGMRREVNQDAYEGRQLGRATLLVVCDGMGGHAAGEVASQLGVETIISTFSDQPPPDDALRQAFVTANQRIYAQGRGSMGTTGVAALFLHDSLVVANVGDSRAYLVREGQISQISHDHSFVSDQVAAGLMTPEQARASNVRNIITRALGHSAEVEVDIFTVALKAGDTVLLSSDGMHGLVADDEIAEVAGMLPLDEAAQRLVDLANERGGSDNITVVIAQVDELDTPGEAADAAITTPLPETAASAAPVERPLSRLGLALASFTLVALLGLGAYLWAAGGSSGAAAPTPTATLAATSTPLRPATPAPPTPTP